LRLQERLRDVQRQAVERAAAAREEAAERVERGVEAALRSVREASAHADKVSLGAKEKVDGTAAKAADSMDAVRDAAREAADQTSVRCAICRCLWFVGPF
jgi:hypothetical protein